MMSQSLSLISVSRPGKTEFAVNGFGQVFVVGDEVGNGLGVGLHLLD